jgi:hypothetical protein
VLEALPSLHRGQLKSARQIFGTCDKHVLNSLIQLLPFCSTVSQREGRFYGIKRSSGLKQRSKETIMSTTSDKPYEPISFAKKHRISVEDARNILDQAAGDKKAADKHARRVSV